jgi:hypothetical protein
MILTSNQRAALQNRFGLNAVADFNKMWRILKTPADQLLRPINTNLPIWSQANAAATWTLPGPGQQKPTFEQDFRKWLQGQFGKDAGLANLRTEMLSLVGNGAACSEVIQWPLLYFAGAHGLPVQWVNDHGVGWANHEIDALDIIRPTVDYRAKTAAAILNQLNKPNLKPFNPQNMLNWRFNPDTDRDDPLTIHYTNDQWTVSADQAAIPWRDFANATAKTMTDRGSQDVSKIQAGDVVMTAVLQHWQGHAEFISDINQDTLTEGKPTLDTEVYLLYNSTRDGVKLNYREGRWVKIRTLLAPGKHDNNHGYQFVIRSLDFSALDQLWPV